MIGATRDDAAGECFDKAAKMLGLPYPGGPQISKLALTGKTDAIKFPRPMLNDNNFDFSFAGLKTSALYYLRDNPKVNKADFCASLEQAIVDTLVGKMARAIKKFKPKTVILCGGVSANIKLRETLRDAVAQFPKTKYMIPGNHYCMDNAAMIARAGFATLKPKAKAGFTDWKKLKADPNWELGR